MGPNKFIIKFEVDVINPKANTLSVGRKKGQSTFFSELDEDELLAWQEEAANMIAQDLTKQGIMLFSKPQIKSIKPKKEPKPNGSGIKALKKLVS